MYIMILCGLLLVLLCCSRFYNISANSDAPDLVSALAWTYSNGHVALSQELARVNPELTLPFFSGEAAR